MKQIQILAILVLSLAFTACNGQDKRKTLKTNNPATKIEVIDFYGTHRCVTCRAIEANAKYTVDTHFKNEKKKGIVVFKKINVDDDKNYKIAERFEAAGTALFINVIKNGKEKHIDLTDFAFAKGKNKIAFSKALKAKIEAELKKL